jgi:hypothetical protein
MTPTQFVQAYPPQPFRRQPDNLDELRQLTSNDGVRQLDRSPAPNLMGGAPKRSGDEGCHLWVIDPSGVPYILERAAVTPPLASGKAKHTNLTGGLPASCGGEFWFDTPQARRLYVNGCSGRYGPLTPQQLEDAVSVFREFGYEVISFEWDEEADKPARVLRERL